MPNPLDYHRFLLQLFWMVKVHSLKIMYVFVSTLVENGKELKINIRVDQDELFFDLKEPIFVPIAS